MNLTEKNPCQQFLNDDRKFISSLYEECYPKMKGLVLENTGNEDDARDVFQTAIVIMFEKCKQNIDFLHVQTSTFIYAVSKFTWWKILKKRKQLRDIPPLSQENENPDWFIEDLNVIKQRLFAKYFNTLSEKHQRLIRLEMEGIEPTQIAKQLGYKSYEYYRLDKYRCLKQLRDKILNDENGHV